MQRGVAAAVRATRDAFDSGRMNATDMCELMLALRRGVLLSRAVTPAANAG